jgi:hypothetical protein
MEEGGNPKITHRTKYIEIMKKERKKEISGVIMYNVRIVGATRVPFLRETPSRNNRLLI